jgi:hypothetical protein
MKKRTRRMEWWCAGLGARLSELGKLNWWPLLLLTGAGGVVMAVVVVLVTAAGAMSVAAVFVGVPGKRSPLMLTVSRLLQWPHRTVTVLNRLLVGTLTCIRTRHVRQASNLISESKNTKA